MRFAERAADGVVAARHVRPALRAHDQVGGPGHRAAAGAAPVGRRCPARRRRGSRRARSGAPSRRRPAGPDSPQAASARSAGHSDVACCGDPVARRVALRGSPPRRGGRGGRRARRAGCRGGRRGRRSGGRRGSSRAGRAASSGHPTTSRARAIAQSCCGYPWPRGTSPRIPVDRFNDRTDRASVPDRAVQLRCHGRRRLHGDLPRPRLVHHSARDAADDVGRARLRPRGAGVDPQLDEHRARRRAPVQRRRGRRPGRRRALVLGSAVLAIASVVCALAPTTAVLRGRTDRGRGRRRGADRGGPRADRPHLHPGVARGAPRERHLGGGPRGWHRGRSAARGRGAGAGGLGGVLLAGGPPRGGPRRRRPVRARRSPAPRGPVPSTCPA